ncbi:MAG: hypothetical protein E7262_04645 [Lachnospiraceae bacterium]|nr:hypothetical protein [Lachnospiraceae bacterium]
MFGHFFGNYLVKNGVITEEQLDSILKSQKSSRVKMGLIAVSEKMLTARQTYEINMLQVTLDKRFGDIAVEKGYLTPEQVNKIISLQGNPYLLFIQNLTEKNLATMEEIETYIQRFKADNDFTDEDIEAFKSGDIDRLTDLFINIKKPLYKEYVSLAIRNIIRFVDSGVIFNNAELVKTRRFQHLATQCVKGDHDVFIGFEGDDDALLSIAVPYTKEQFDEVDEDVYDAVCEFTNCINGLFASKLSYEGVNIDMLPPLFYTDAELVSEQGFYSIPLIVNSKKVNLLISIDSDIMIK